MTAFFSLVLSPTATAPYEMIYLAFIDAVLLSMALIVLAAERDLARLQATSAVV
jgi:hypothetical protein